MSGDNFSIEILLTFKFLITSPAMVCASVERITIFVSPLPVLCAPMAEITDLPFRKLVARFGTALVVSEMIASQDMVLGRSGSQKGRAWVWSGRAQCCTTCRPRNPLDGRSGADG